MYKYIKIIFDKIFSLILIILLLPLFCLIILVLKLNGVDKIIYKQERSGLNNRKFLIYKFRTLNGNNNICSFCNYLRRTGLDEIPQLFNILKGDMSFIGPRPWICDYSKYYDKNQMKRLSVFPGLTGLAQVNICNNVFEKINYDLFYVSNLSIKMDIKILYKTFMMIFNNKKDSYNYKEIKKEISDLRKQYYRRGLNES